MKKILLIFIITLFLTGCGNSNNVPEQTSQSSQSSQSSQISESESEKKSCYSVNKYENVKIEILTEHMSNDTLTIKVINNSEEEVIFGEWFVIEICKNGVWYEIEPRQEVVFDDIGYLVEPNCEKTYSFRYRYVYEFNESSKYRIIKKFLIGEEKYFFADEFEVSL